MIRRRGRQGCLALVACALSWTLPLAAEENNADGTRSAAASTPASTNSDIDQLKAMLMEQQRQIDELRRQLADQKSATTAATSGAAQPAEPSGLHKNLGEVASTTPVVPGVAASASAATLPTTLPITTNVATQAARAGGTARNPCEENPEGPTPAFIRLGSTCLVPIGFMDMTAVWRDKNTGSSIGSNFGSVPYNNTVNGRLSEYRFSPQNSRIGFRFDGDWKGTHFIGYNEFDFLGTSGSNALTVTNGAFVPRLRLFWVDVRKGKLEFLAGQSWSMLTPNRRGISALPGDLFYSQTVDVNYMAGLTWTRQPGFRVLYHPSNTVTFGFSAENPEQYIGGSAGGSTITLPAAAPLAGLSNTQL